MPHCLPLATSQAAKTFPELATYRHTLISIYSYFSYSSLCVHNLHELQNFLEDPSVRYQSLYEIRWLSFFDAVCAIKCPLNSLLTYMEQQCAHYDDPVAKGLVKQVSSYFSWPLHTCSMMSSVILHDSVR